MEELESIRKLPRKERKALLKQIREEYKFALANKTTYRPKCFGIDKQTSICKACIWKDECLFQKMVNDNE